MFTYIQCTYMYRVGRACVFVCLYICICMLHICKVLGCLRVHAYMYVHGHLCSTIVGVAL